MQYLPASDDTFTAPRSVQLAPGLLAEQVWLARMEWMGSRTQSGLKGRGDWTNGEVQRAGKRWMRPWRMGVPCGDC